MKRYAGAKGKADRLFSEVIRSVGYCEAEGYDDKPCSPSLQCAHICSRRFNSTRTDTRNAFSMCASHHRFFTDHPREFSRFITTTWAADHYDLMYQKSRTATKINWDERIAFLDRIKQGEITLDEARTMEEQC